MHELKRFATRELNLHPEQVQIFTPTPLTAATCMYYTGFDPTTGQRVTVTRGLKDKQRQKDILTVHSDSRGGPRLCYNPKHEKTENRPHHRRVKRHR
jgi:radical SAM superfamily enzyme YgiQ (UPF0313 family)